MADRAADKLTRRDASMWNFTSPGKSRLGCGFLLVSAVLTCVLLAINGLIITNLVQAASPGPLPLHDQRPLQAVVFLGPVLLLFIEWWVCDVAIDWLRPQHSSPQRKQG